MTKLLGGSAAGGERLNVLLIGGGGREHALAWAMAKSPRLARLFCAPGNAGIAEVASCAPLDVEDHGAIIAFCREENIDFVVVGPEAPLVAGLADDLTAAGYEVFGPSKAAARLEASKGFTKDLCARYDIPTAPYARFTDADKANAYARAAFRSTPGTPLVIKADGLAAGKGVTIAETLEQAEAAIADCFGGAFGDAGAEVIIEGFLEGEEASLFVLCDGENICPLASAQDHKRTFDGDKGPNTGGMGAYSPAPVLTPDLLERAIEDIIRPTVRALAEDGTPFRGVLYAGLMLTKNGPELIEYNVRFGDPECQVLMVRLESDLLELLEATATGRLDRIDVQWLPEAALTVVMAAQGYPGPYQKGEPISGLSEARGVEGVTLFHAGTKAVGDEVCSNGGRVLNVTARGQDLREARDRAYAAIERIKWPGGFYRRDIAWRALD